MIFSGYVTEGASDWDDASATATTIAIIRTNDLNGDPTFQQDGYALLNTSAVTTGGTPIITSATFYWKHTTADSTRPMTTSIWNGTDWTIIYAGNGGAANAWISVVVTASTTLGYINGSGGTKTAIKFVNTLVSPSITRTAKIQSYEGATSGTPYVVLAYTYPAVKKRRPYIIS